MARKLPEEFEGKDISPLCIAATLAEANKIENILNKEEVDYTFEISSFTSGFGIGITEGVLFLVYSGQLTYCRESIRKSGLSHLLIKDE